MTAYRTVEHLKASLWRAKLPTYADAIARSVKPVILFLRVQAQDDGLPVAASKMGGVPDLPDGFAWPTRGPYPDAAERARRALDFARDTAAKWEKQVDGPLEPHQRRIPREEIDRLKTAGDARARAFGEPFPLAFVGQIDLAAMASEPGFDADLPRTGLLSVFEDVTDSDLAETPALFWHDVPREALKRRPPPESLVAHVDLCGSYGLGQDTPWATLDMAETLVPFSAFSVPHHWKFAFPQGGPEWSRIWNWFQSGDGEYAPAAPDFSGHGENPPQASYFGDRLGGWPHPIQGDVETEMDGVRITTPGKTDWRQIFAYAGEFYGGTRRMGSDGKGDGTTYHMIRADDLAARRFEASGWTYQMD
ncbi:YwqG family protein [Chenggangzhangella methanolivorans]|uniref:DUF1963 domain-containing protein n=1 Tax=Chenggangzhangella methanolivorans TaxID=1437009 RepID=A0A9E6R5B3_9HYPH|nr:YwqG family protein [Chenggangzhangella methanolivorans]QZN98480.1 DUF1963 domain-containing protein [Chenggangzhangella methanolivorans]